MRSFYSRKCVTIKRRDKPLTFKMKKKKENNNKTSKGHKYEEKVIRWTKSYYGYNVARINGELILQHRYIMEQHLGRKLKAEEIVHHINDDKLDNRIDNLKVMTNAEHLSHHHKGKISYQSIKNVVSSKLPHLFEPQRSLFVGAKIRPQYKLVDNYFHLLDIFNLNPETRFTRNILFLAKSREMHFNTVSNFIKHAIANNLIDSCSVIKGKTINTAYFFEQLPDTFEDGTKIKNKNSRYYVITEKGKEVYEINYRDRENSNA